MKYALDAIRRNPIECIACQTMVMPDQIEAHRVRCPGRAWGGDPKDAGWLSWRALADIGLPRASLHRWCVSGRVARRKGEDGAWEYSRADVAAAMLGCLGWYRPRVAQRKRSGNGRHRRFIGGRLSQQRKR
jgi:hypothetical protein